MGCPAYTYSPTLEPKIKRLKKELTLAESKKTARVVYLFGFGGHEKDDEIHNNEGTSYTTEYRQYDSRIGRWTSVDPLAEETMEPYSFSYNNPICFVDPDGRAPDDIIDINKKTGKITVTKAEGDDVVRLVDNGKVVDSYTYGENGSFNKENKLITGELTNSKGKTDKGQYVVSTNNTKAFEFFKFAAKSDVEFSYNKYKNAETNKSASVVATSHDKGQETFEGMIAYKLLTTTKNINLVDSWHSHPGIYDKNTGWPAYPSGFDHKGNIKSSEVGDRDRYIWNKKYFPKRTPLYNYIYIPSAKKVVKHNGETYTVK